MGHRTGIGTIFNQTNVSWTVSHPETGRSRTIPASGDRTFRCDDIFGWVSNDGEMQARALQFRTTADGVLRLLMFQTYSTNAIEFVRAPAGNFLSKTATGVIEVGCAGVRITGAAAPFTPVAYVVY